jgi:Vps4 C terminal oligomerisation domain
MAIRFGHIDFSVACRYSGSDIAIIVRDALMQPIRKVINAEHFKPVRDPENPDNVKWTPCSSGDPEAVEKSWVDINSDELQEPPLKIGDFLRSLATVRPTVTDADVRRHDQWTKESGALLGSMHSLELTVALSQEMMGHDDLCMHLDYWVNVILIIPRKALNQPLLVFIDWSIREHCIMLNNNNRNVQRRIQMNMYEINMYVLGLIDCI